jgi:hypothetical protein
MKLSEIRHHRLRNQQIAEPAFSNPRQLVEWMGAMQAQEYAMAKWAIGLRLPASTDAAVEEAFDNGQILRTHLLRPTWHFVSPADIRWMLALSAPQVNALGAYMYRQLELDKKIFIRSASVIAKALEGGKYLTRLELQNSLKQKKIIADGLRLGCIMIHAELDGLICSGPRKGKQFTYALLDERVPATPVLTRDESLARLSNIYFISRAPATIADFATWSGLSKTEAKKAAAMLGSNFIKQRMGDEEYIVSTAPITKISPARSSFLMPDYDEYGMGYKDRSALQSQNTKDPRKVSIGAKYNRFIVINGVIEGTWNRVVTKQAVEVQPFPYNKLSSANERLMQSVIKRYKTFMKGGKDRAE